MSLQTEFSKLRQEFYTLKRLFNNLNLSFSLLANLPHGDVELTPGDNTIVFTSNVANVNYNVLYTAQDNDNIQYLVGISNKTVHGFTASVSSNTNFKYQITML